MKLLRYVLQSVISMLILGLVGSLLALIPALLVSIAVPERPWDEVIVVVAVPIALLYVVQRIAAEGWPEAQVKTRISTWRLIGGSAALFTLLLFPSMLIYAALGLWWAVTGAAVISATSMVLMMALGWVTRPSVARAVPRAVFATLALVACHLNLVREQVYARHATPRSAH